MWRAYRIYLEEAEVLPRVRSLADVVRLQADPRLRPWRETMHQWWLSLRSGDQNAEHNLRAEITKANRDLRKLDHWRKIGGIVTYVSLPIAVASALTGFPGGLVMAPLGVGMRVYSEVQQRRHRWLMLGR